MKLSKINFITEELLIPLFTFGIHKTRFEKWSSRKVELEKQMDSLIESTSETVAQNVSSKPLTVLGYDGGLVAALGSSFAYILQTLTSIPLTLLTFLIASLILWMPIRYSRWNKNTQS